ncbi:MAG TPA: hypothetical protein VHA75_08035 [Rugosimonospora sp.]|nr:hypothetical protein [Rugosimonospora sp.]
MSNRPRRRRIPVPADVRRSLACPDCTGRPDPTARVVDGVLALAIRHDDSCPWYRARGEHREYFFTELPSPGEAA